MIQFCTLSKIEPKVEAVCSSLSQQLIILIVLHISKVRILIFIENQFIYFGGKRQSMRQKYFEILHLEMNFNSDGTILLLFKLQTLKLFFSSNPSKTLQNN